MIGGKILDWRKSPQHTSVLVKGTGVEEKDTAIVRVKLPDHILEEVEKGDSIWWQDGKVMLNVLNCSDVPFEKVSNTYGDARRFYSEGFEVEIN